MNKIFSSARNQFEGKVTKIKKGEISSEISLDIGDGQFIYATITDESRKILDLKEGSAAYAIIKASWVIIAKRKLKTSARNNLEGKVVECKKGAVNSEVTVDLGNGKIITSIITNQSFDNLDIKVNDTVWALVKAPQVIIAVE